MRISSLTQVFAKARLFEASEGRSHVGLVVGVDEDSASVEPLTDVQCLADVPGKNAGRQTVLGCVGPSQNVVHFPVEGRAERRQRCSEEFSTRVELYLNVAAFCTLPALELGNDHDGAE